MNEQEQLMLQVLQQNRENFRKQDENEFEDELKFEKFDLSTEQFYESQDKSSQKDSLQQEKRSSLKDHTNEELKLNFVARPQLVIQKSIEIEKSDDPQQTQTQSTASDHPGQKSSGKKKEEKGIRIVDGINHEKQQPQGLKVSLEVKDDNQENQINQFNMAIYLNNKREIEKKKNLKKSNLNEDAAKKPQIKKISKLDFRYQKQSKVANILNDEEELGEVGEWIESTAAENKKQLKIDSDEDENQNQSEDEFDVAFREGFKKPSEATQTQTQGTLEKQAFHAQELEQERERQREQKILAQQRAQQKVQNLSNGAYNSNKGYMVNRLQQKAKVISVKDDPLVRDRRSTQTKAAADDQNEQEAQEEVVQIPKDVIDGTEDLEPRKSEELNPIRLSKKQSSGQESRPSNASSGLSRQTYMQSGVNNIPIIDDEEFPPEEDQNVDQDELQDVVQDLATINRKSNERRPADQIDDSKSQDDEWEAVSKQTIMMQQLRNSNQSLKTLKTVEFQDAWAQIRSKDLTEQLKQVGNQNIEKRESFLETLKSLMCSRKTLESQQLLSEKDFILAFSRVKFEDADLLHFQMLYTIFNRLRDEERCLRYGPHWESIGFQGSDPASDIRGVGMFGILQLLFFSSCMKDLMDEMLNYSHHEQYHFPLCSILLNISSFVLQYLRDDRLNNMINAEKQVMSVLNRVFVATAWQFYQKYKRQKASIEEIGLVLKQIREEVEKSPRKVVEDFAKQLEKIYKNKSY